MAHGKALELRELRDPTKVPYESIQTRHGAESLIAVIRGVGRNKTTHYDRVAAKVFTGRPKNVEGNKLHTKSGRTDKTRAIHLKKIAKLARAKFFRLRQYR